MPLFVKQKIFHFCGKNFAKSLDFSAVMCYNTDILFAGV